MPDYCRALIARTLVVAGLSGLGLAQESSPSATDLIKKIATKCENAKQYAFEGDLEIARRSGQEKPKEVLAKAKVKFAAAPGGKYLLRVERINQSQYLVVSDGQKSWAYVPRLNKYTERDAAAIVLADDPDQPFDVQASAQRDIAVEFSHLVMPILARLAKTADVTFLKDSQLTLLSKKDDRQRQNMVQLTLDTASLVIKRMAWMNAVPSPGDDKMLVRSDFTFQSFLVDVPLSEADFTFHPPKTAQRVASLPIAGQSQSSLLNKPAPGFELDSLDGGTFRLSELRGHPVLLIFCASWCRPCQAALALVEKIHEEHKNPGLITLAIGSEGRDAGPSDRQPAKLPFPILDDSLQKVHRLYGVRFMPTVILIDGTGTLVRILSSAPDEQALRAALKPH
jgi:thiol-disulfide isomerase/thioredoxin